MDEYPCKSSEKSSPSFPEDADDDEEPMAEHLTEYNRSESQECHPSTESPLEQMPADVTMTADDEDDEMEGLKPISASMDSPKPNADLGDKKVHWTTRHVQLLLDRVEEHLHEFNVQKKHKAVWQAIGAEMEPYGFTTEHCYNKWKNLRRDVRLLVNNPMKVVRNASILRQVARLILVIYPNVDATTMQVCDRSGIKSTPVTPGGPGCTTKSNTSNAHFSGLNSPHCKLGTANLSCLNNALYGSSGGMDVHSTPNTVEKSFGGVTKSGAVPGTALFVNSLANGEKPQAGFADRLQPEPDSTAPLPFPFNPAAAALLLQSQLFSDLVKQQQQRHQDEGIKSQDQAHDLSATQNGTSNSISILQQALSNPPTSDFSALPSLTANLLTSLVGLTSQVVESGCQNTAGSASALFPNLPPNLVERFSSNSGEIAGIVERLQAEEAVHFRLTDMISHLAEELRAAGQRRQATLNQLLGLVKGHVRTPTATTDSGNVT
ncbi:unnamed protein product [Mesocestoides corti]|uniref:Myb-like domain-containing protein n=1 Tax=Mesocestoides corti TaxID=53468 RepID=A0A0R3U635_MESCO|nr:unnamed protein product [Mesocestoides corti]